MIGIAIVIAVLMVLLAFAAGWITYLHKLWWNTNFS